MTRINHFIGYGDLSRWAASADKQQPVYAKPIADPGKPDSRGVSIQTHVVLVQQIDEHDHVHYVRIVTGRETCINGDRLPGPKNVQARTQSAWEIVQGWLLANGFQLREAVIAQPHGLSLLNGHADEIMRYDEKLDRFVVAELVAA